MSDNKLSSKTTSIAFRVPNELASSIAAKATAEGRDRTSVMQEMLMGIPSVLVDQRATFPQVSALYLVWAANSLLYIGKTECLRSEFRNHPRLIEFLNEDAKVAWFDPDACGSLQVALDGGTAQASRSDLESQIADLASQVSILQSQLVDRPFAPQEPTVRTKEPSEQLETNGHQDNPIVSVVLGGSIASTETPITPNAIEDNGFSIKSADIEIAPLEPLAVPQEPSEIALEPLATARVKIPLEPLDPLVAMASSVATEAVKSSSVSVLVPEDTTISTPEFDKHVRPLIKPYGKTGGHYFIMAEATQGNVKLEKSIKEQAKRRGFQSFKGTLEHKSKNIWLNRDWTSIM